MAKKSEEVLESYEIKPNHGVNKPKKRVGRGNGSGTGKTCGKGEKGQKSRKGKTRPYVGFEGGQMPLNRRLPKRGFSNSPFKKKTAEVKLSDLNVFKDGDEVNIQVLKDRKMIRRTDERVKILAGGELTKKLTINVYNASKGALSGIEKSGSTFIKLEPKTKKTKAEKKS